MARTFMSIMNVIHHVVRFCTMTLKNNIMLHFPFDKPNVVYIGVCNWGEVRCMQKVIPFLYVFAKEEDAINAKKMH